MELSAYAALYVSGFWLGLYGRAWDSLFTRNCIWIDGGCMFTVYEASELMSGVIVGIISLYGIG